MSGTLSKLFGDKPTRPTAVPTAQPVTKERGDIAKDELLKRLATLRRASMTSDLSVANVKRKTLGAGSVS